MKTIKFAATLLLAALTLSCASNSPSPTGEKRERLTTEMALSREPAPGKGGQTDLSSPYSCAHKKTSMEALMLIKGSAARREALHRDMTRLRLGSDPSENSCLNTWRQQLLRLYSLTASESYTSEIEKILREMGR